MFMEQAAHEHARVSLLSATIDPRIPDFYSRFTTKAAAALLALCLAVAACAPLAAPAGAQDHGAALLPQVRAAAQQGDAAAQYNLGMMYAHGWNVARDDTQAALWLRQSAEQGFALAQNGLGRLYAQGRGVTQDRAQAAFWYRQAAAQGLAEAQSNLAALPSARGH